jgi:hypothetical protein
MAYHNTVKTCEYCGADFREKDYRQRYCDHSCAATASNIARGSRPKENKLCVSCGRKLAKHQTKYCTRECQRAMLDEKFIGPWLNGQVSGSNARGILKPIYRRYLLKLADHACTRCGWCEANPKLGRPILTIDHKDGNWRNNKIENLIVLCYNCHTLTPTFGALNIGNGAGSRGTYDRTAIIYE